MEQKSKHSCWVFWMVLAFATVNLFLDIFLLITAQVNATRHIPFFTTLIFYAFAWMVWYLDHFPEKRTIFARKDMNESRQDD